MLKNFLNNQSIQRILPLLLVAFLWLSGIPWAAYANPCCHFGHGPSSSKGILHSQGVREVFHSGCCTHQNEPSLQHTQGNCPCQLLPQEPPKATSNKIGVFPPNTSIEDYSQVDLGHHAIPWLALDNNLSTPCALTMAHRAPPINHRQRYLDLQKLLH